MSAGEDAEDVRKMCVLILGRTGLFMAIATVTFHALSHMTFGIILKVGSVNILFLR